MKGVCGAQGDVRQGEKKILRTAMDVTRQLDALVRRALEALDDRTLHATRDCLGEGALAHTPRQR